MISVYYYSEVVFFPLSLYMYSGKRSDEIIELNNKQMAVFKAILIWYVVCRISRTKNSEKRNKNKKCYRSLIIYFEYFILKNPSAPFFLCSSRISPIQSLNAFSIPDRQNERLPWENFRAQVNKHINNY